MFKIIGKDPELLPVSGSGSGINHYGFTTQHSRAQIDIVFTVTFFRFDA